MTENGFQDLLSLLSDSHVEYILIGGLAGMAMGSSRATLDVDVVYRRSPENMHRLAGCLADHRPYLRGAPPGLPFRFDEDTIRNGLNFTLTTDLGDIDFFGEVPGGGNYEQLIEHTQRLHVFGVDLNCVRLEKLIELKRAAGRPRDLEALAELEILREERDKLGRRP